MTSLERCQAVLAGSMPDFVPVVPQSFLFASQFAGFTMADVNRDPGLMAKAHILSQEKFGYDGCVIDFDDASLAEACGAKTIYRNDEPAVVDESVPLLSDLRLIEDLEIPDPKSSPRLLHWLEATDLISGSIGDHVFIIGRADQGPFSLACLLRGTSQFMIDLVTEPPEMIGRLIDYCTKACIAFGKAQKEAGAHATSIGDALAGPSLISPQSYRLFALGPEKEWIEKVQTPVYPCSIHICGDTSSIIQDILSTGASIMEIDSPVDISIAKKIYADRKVIMGNISTVDPLVLGNPEDVDNAVKELIRKSGGRGLFISSGCAMGRNTKPANVGAMVAAAKKYGSRDQIMELGNRNA